MKKKTAVAPIMVFLIGAGIFLYPFVANQIAQYRQSKEITVYETAVSAADKAELEQQREEAEKYNDNLSGDPVHDPFVLNSGYVLPENYLNVLNLSGDGVMCYIEIPKISVNLPVYHGTDERVLQKGAGHIEGTALPLGGEYRHSILCAHRGLPSAELFTRLDEMGTGDLFYIHVLGEIHAYEVDRVEVVLPEEISGYLVPEEGKDQITLMTCTPYGVNTHRILVRGTRTEYVPEEKELIRDEKEEKTVWIAVVTGIILCVGGGGICLAHFRRKKKGRRRKR